MAKCKALTRSAVKGLTWVRYGWRWDTLMILSHVCVFLKDCTVAPPVNAVPHYYVPYAAK